MVNFTPARVFLGPMFFVASCKLQITLNLRHEAKLILDAVWKCRVKWNLWVVQRQAHTFLFLQNAQTASFAMILPREAVCTSNVHSVLMSFAAAATTDSAMAQYVKIFYHYHFTTGMKL